MKVSKKERLGIVIFLLPALILFAVFFIYPIMNVVYMSFFNWNGISDATFAGFKNYIRIFSDKVFLRSIKNNIVWALAASCIQVPMALLMALILSRKPKGWKLFRTIYGSPAKSKFGMQK